MRCSTARGRESFQHNGGLMTVDTEWSNGKPTREPERRSGWYCKCPGGFNHRSVTEADCGRCGATSPHLPPGNALMRYQRQLALEQREEAERRRERGRYER